MDGRERQLQIAGHEGTRERRQDRHHGGWGYRSASAQPPAIPTSRAPGSIASTQRPERAPLRPASRRYGERRQDILR